MNSLAIAFEYTINSICFTKYEYIAALFILFFFIISLAKQTKKVSGIFLLNICLLLTHVISLDHYPISEKWVETLILGCLLFFMNISLFDLYGSNAPRFLKVLLISAFTACFPIIGMTFFKDLGVIIGFILAFGVWNIYIIPKLIKKYSITALSSLTIVSLVLSFSLKIMTRGLGFYFLAIFFGLMFFASFYGHLAFYSRVGYKIKQIQDEEKNE